MRIKTYSFQTPKLREIHKKSLTFLVKWLDELSANETIKNFSFLGNYSVIHTYKAVI